MERLLIQRVPHRAEFVIQVMLRLDSLRVALVPHPACFNNDDRRTAAWELSIPRSAWGVAFMRMVRTFSAMCLKVSWIPLPMPVMLFLSAPIMANNLARVRTMAGCRVAVERMRWPVRHCRGLPHQEVKLIRGAAA